MKQYFSFIWNAESIDLSMKMGVWGIIQCASHKKKSLSHFHSLLVVRVLHDKNIIYNFNCEKGQNTVYINTMKRIEREDKKVQKKLFKAHPGALYSPHTVELSWGK